MTARLPTLALLAFGCGGDGPLARDTGATPAELALPAPGELPEREEPPDPFVSYTTGEPVAWERRRPELLTLFQHYVYGWSAAPATASLRERTEEPVEGGRLVQLWGAVEGPDGTERELLVALWLPTDTPRAIVLGLNKCGNPTVQPEPLLADSGGWAQEDCDPTPGSRASYWNVEAALAEGFAVATVHQSDLHPDDPTVADGMLGWALPGSLSEDDRWGALGAWAWGLSRAVDLLDEETGAIPVVVMGHSRRGKTALWATAQDLRIDGVWAHQSGTGGAALSRHREGETIGAVTTLFPHWFAGHFAAFEGQEALLPLDQHLLIALSAPRPVRITDGDADVWADPEGARMAVELATPVFAAEGGPGPVWALRPGDHAVTPRDWLDAIGWLQEHW